MGIIERLGIKAESSKEVKSEPDDHIERPIKLEIELDDDESGQSNEAVFVDIKDYSDDDIYQKLRRKGVDFQEEDDGNGSDDQTLTLNCMKCDYTAKKAKNLMKHIQTAHKNQSKLRKSSKLIKL